MVDFYAFLNQTPKKLHALSNKITLHKSGTSRLFKVTTASSSLSLPPSSRGIHSCHSHPKPSRLPIAAAWNVCTRTCMCVCVCVLALMCICLPTTVAKLFLYIHSHFAGTNSSVQLQMTVCAAVNRFKNYFMACVSLRPCVYVCVTRREK